MRTTFATDWLVRPLACLPYQISYKPDPTPTAEEIDAETERLNALPRDQQLRVFCAAMGFGLFEYLAEQAAFTSEVLHEIEWLHLDGAE